MKIYAAVAGLVLMSAGAVGQTPQYTVEVIVNDKPMLAHADANPKWPHGLERTYALMAATHATVWTPQEWAETQARMCKDASLEVAQMFECPGAPAEQPAPTQPQAFQVRPEDLCCDHQGLCTICEGAKLIPSTRTVEHVAPILPCAPSCKFEVRTKRQSICRVKVAPNEVCPGDPFKRGFDSGYRIRITHELWLNGSKLGTLEGQ